MFRVLVLIFLVCFSACAISKQPHMNHFSPAKNIVVAHRGAWKKNNLPENSIASLRNAIELNCAGSEFDVRMTADDSLVINHDPNYNHLPIEKSTYANLAKLPLSNGEKFPTLQQYLQAGMTKNTATKFVCEIKPSDISVDRARIVATKVLALVKSMKAENRITYISFDFEILKQIIAIDPTAITQYLDGNKSPDEIKAAGISGIDYHFSVFKAHPDWIALAKKNNLILNAWTVNDLETMNWLLSNQFDFITTNEPELLFNRIKQNAS